MTDRPVKSALTELLGQVRDGKEIRTYLQRFATAGGTKFAVFKLGGAVLQEDLETVATGLAMLNTVGLTPVVVHGAGPQLDEAITKAGLDAGKVDGLRVTTPAIMDLTARIAMNTSLMLASAIERQGGKAVAIPPAAVRATLLDENRYGRVGKPTDIATNTIEQVASSGVIPVLSNIGVDTNTQLVNINADTVARTVAHCFEPLKIVFVTGTGGILDDNKNIISAINLKTDLSQLIADGSVHSGMQLKLEEIAKLLEDMPASTSVSITSPSGIVRELFTHGGYGTLVRLGETYEIHESLDDIDTSRLISLIEKSFGRTLSDNYLDTIDIHRIYLSSNYRAAAIVTKVGDAIMLDKFVVAPDARGEGLTHSLWRMMTEADPVIYWRSRRTNGFNDFYMAKADGFVRRDPWLVFWAGQPSLKAIPTFVEQISSRTPSFIEDMT